jgi:2-methylcitrate dehydratase PrpD
MLAAKFSLPFALATTVVHGAATVPAFREKALGDAAVLDLARRVVVREDPALTAQLPALRPARLAITLKDGRVLHAQATTNRGDTEDPYTPDEVRAKFHELADPVWGGDHASRIVAAIDRLEQGDFQELLPLLAQRPCGVPLGD